MATRLLLTLLALLTGLAAQIAPAQARIRAEGASAVGALIAEVQSERAEVARSHVARRPAERLSSQRRCAVLMLREVPDCAPPVMLGIDRSRQ